MIESRSDVGLNIVFVICSLERGVLGWSQKFKTSIVTNCSATKNVKI